MPDSTPHIAQKGPFKVEVEAGKTYYWCTCGNSNSQPFCDGSHKGGTFTPLAYTADATGTKLFCGCKHSGAKPMCDGAHKQL